MSRLAKALTAIFVVLLLLAAAAFVAEISMKKIVPQKFSENIREYLSLSTDHPVEIELTGLISLQYLTGGFQKVQVSVPDVPLKDGMRATLSGSADYMPVNPSKKELKNAVVKATFDAEQLNSVVQVLSRGIGQEVEISGQDIKIVNTINFFGQKIPIKIVFKAAAQNGQLHIDPVAVEAAGLINLTVEQLPNYEPLQKFASGFDICVEQFFPQGLRLEAIELSTVNSLSVSLSIADRIGLDEELQEFGSC